jgi:lipopolysaccharide export system permease protein
VYFNNSVLPDANHRLKNLASDIRRKKPTLSLVNGVFSQDIPGYSILVRRAVPKTNDLVGVTIYDFTNPSSNVVITARRGTVSFSPDYRRLIMDLQEGEIHELDLQNQNSYRRVRFEKHRIAMDVQGFDFERTAEAASQRGDRELSARAMQVFVDSLSLTRAALEKEFADVMRRDVELRASGLLDAPLSGAPGQSPPAYLPVTTPLLALRQTQATVTTYMFRLENLERQLDQYEVEINKKYSIPAACIVFVFVGVPLGIMSRRGGFGVAATLSLGFFILYWACLIGGEKLADRDIVQPFVGMWIANVLIGLFGVYLTFRIGRETILIDWSFLHRLVPRRWRDRLQDEMPEPEVEA